MKKIVIASRPYDELSCYLVQLVKELFPECEVQVECAEAEVPADRLLSQWSPLTGD